MSEKTATDVHGTLCTFVTTQAVTHSSWAEYAAMFLSAEVQDLIRSRLAARLAADPTAAEDGESSSPSKKRKVPPDDNAAAENVAPPVRICEHCGGAVPEISLRVACLDGTTLNLTVPERELVREVKRSIGQVERVVSKLVFAFSHVVPRRAALAAT